MCWGGGAGDGGWEPERSVRQGADPRNLDGCEVVRRSRLRFHEGVGSIGEGPESKGSTDTGDALGVPLRRLPDLRPPRLRLCRDRVDKELTETPKKGKIWSWVGRGGAQGPLAQIPPLLFSVLWKGVRPVPAFRPRGWRGSESSGHSQPGRRKIGRRLGGSSDRGLPSGDKGK